MKERRKWSKVSATCFVLAVLMPIISRIMPKPMDETEAVVEQYLLTRVGMLVLMAVFAFLGLLVMTKYLRCPHCGAFGLKQIQFCTNCGKDLDAEVVEELSAEEEASESVEEIEASADQELAEVGEGSEFATEKE